MFVLNFSLLGQNFVAACAPDYNAVHALIISTYVKKVMLAHVIIEIPLNL